MAYLVRNLKLAKISSSLTSQIYRKISYPKFRSQGSCAAESGSTVSRLEDGMVDCQGFQKWSNGGGLFHRSASIDPAAVFEIGAVIHPRATLCANVHVGSGGVVGPNVVVGHSTRLGYNVSLSNCSIGDSCVIHNGVCIGQDGFGFFLDEHGNMAKKPQTLFVRIGNHVELGANTCVDKRSWRDTMIGDYTKIDNLVQVALLLHLISDCSQCNYWQELYPMWASWNCRKGDYVTLGGRVAVRDHVSIVSKVCLAANSCVQRTSWILEIYGGFPAVPVQKWRRQVAAQQLFSYKKDIKSP